MIVCIFIVDFILFHFADSFEYVDYRFRLREGNVNLGISSTTGSSSGDIYYATVSGGSGNTASGSSSTVSGGSNNTADGYCSWAGGRNMQLTDTANHTFVWGHSTSPISIAIADAFIIYSGNVGIGTTNPQGYKLHVAGNAYSTATWSGSDERWKKNIEPLENSLAKVNLLQGVSYEWRVDEYPDL